MGYIALKPMPKNGVGVADPIPEAAKWRNLPSWIRSGHIALVPDGAEEEVREMLKAGKVPPPGMLSMTSYRHAAQAAQRLTGKKGAEPAQAPAPKPQASESAEDGEIGHTEAQLKRLSRDELNTVAAEEYGIENAAELASKGDVIEAIFAEE